IDDLAFAELVEIVFGVVIPDQLVDVDDIERAILESEAGWHRRIEALEDGLDLFLAVVVLDGIDVAETKPADKERALIAPGHLPRSQNAGRINFDLEARRQLDLLEACREFRIGCTGRRSRFRGETLLSLGLVAEEPVRRRIVPEILGAGFVFLQSLRGGRHGRRNDEHRRERKNRSIEPRIHRVAPFAAAKLRPYF